MISPERLETVSYNYTVPAKLRELYLVMLLVFSSDKNALFSLVRVQ